MKPHAFQILLALSEGDLHGTGVVRRVREQTGGAVELWPVTLHRTLDRLHEDALIAELGPGEHPAGESRRRRYYRLTDAGAAALSEEADRLRGFVTAARRSLGKEKWRS